MALTPSTDLRAEFHRDPWAGLRVDLHRVQYLDGPHQTVATIWRRRRDDEGVEQAPAYVVAVAVALPESTPADILRKVADLYDVGGVDW